jgi:hypothetical protein
VRAIDCRHPNLVALVRQFWRRPVLNELGTRRVITQAGGTALSQNHLLELRRSVIEMKDLLRCELKCFGNPVG